MTLHPLHDLAPGKKGLILWVVLIAMGLAGNHAILPTSLVAGAKFGSIFALLALQFCGRNRGIVTAAIVSGYAVILCNAPYAFLIMTVEVAVVGTLIWRRNMELVLADTLFWIFVGMPVLYQSYHMAMRLPYGSLSATIAPQVLNAIANALAARLIFMAFALRSLRAPLLYRHLAYNVVVFFVVAPTLIVLAAGAGTSATLPLLVLLPTLVLAEVAIRRVFRPLEQLQTLTQELPVRLSADCNDVWPESRINEIGVLAVNFKRMSEALLSQSHQISRLNERLQHEMARSRELVESEKLTLDVVSSLSSNIDALLESEKRYRLLFDNAGDAVFIHDAHGRMLAVNPQACQRLGYTEGELISMTIDQVDTPEEAHSAPERIARLMEHGSLIFETVHRCKDGAPVPTEVSARKVVWSGQTAMMSICRDITVRKRAQDELREATQLVGQIISSAQEGIIVHGPDLRYRTWNGFMEQLTGKPAGEVLGKHPAEVFRGLTELGLVEHLDRVLCEGTPADMDFPSVSESGIWSWTSYLSSPLLNSRGEINGVISTVRNITWRKQMEAELRLALKTAEKANATLLRFLSMVAHEFRTPLGLLVGSTEILDRYWDRLSQEKRLQQHEHIRHAVRQLTSLVNSVTSLNPARGDRTRRSERLVDVEECCRGIADDVGAVWGAGHDFKVVVAGECGSAMLDDFLLRRVLENLLTNAFRYTPPDGKVSLQVRREKNRLLLEVVDTGIGIPEQDLKLIFEAFYRCDNVEGRRGLGLGLSIVQESLTRMLGTIAVTSKVGEGTAMTVEIPLAEQEQTACPGLHDCDEATWGGDAIDT